MIATTRTFTELSKFLTFDERYEYLKLGGVVGQSVFGFDRYLNQTIYASRRWKKARDFVIIRDSGRDLGIAGYEIRDHIVIHHMNPLTMDDVESINDDIFNPEFLICTRHMTHIAIHYGDKSLLPVLPITRYPNDTTPWH